MQTPEQAFLSHFSPFQLTETGVFVGVAAILILVAARMTLEHTC